MCHVATSTDAGARAPMVFPLPAERHQHERRQHLTLMHPIHQLFFAAYCTKSSRQAKTEWTNAYRHCSYVQRVFLQGEGMMDARTV